MDASYHATIHDLPPDERPRERLLDQGPGSLTTAELLAIILRTGTREESAVRLAERVLREMGSLRDIAQSHVEALSEIKGIGTVKAIEIRAAIELGKRLAQLGDGVKPIIHTPADVARLVMPDLRNEAQEHFKILMLDSKNQVLRSPTITVGMV